MFYLNIEIFKATKKFLSTITKQKLKLDMLSP